MFHVIIDNEPILQEDEKMRNILKTRKLLKMQNILSLIQGSH